MNPQAAQVRPVSTAHEQLRAGNSTKGSRQKLGQQCEPCLLWEKFSCESLTMPNRLSDIWNLKRVAPAAAKVDGFSLKHFRRQYFLLGALILNVHTVYDVDTSLRVFCRY